MCSRRDGSSSASAQGGNARSSRPRASTSTSAASCSPTRSRRVALLWAPGAASFTSTTINFERIWCEPKPVQPGGIPVFFSGTLTPRNVRRIVTLGDGWFPIMDATTDDVAGGAVFLREKWVGGRTDRDSLRIHARLPVVTGAAAARRRSHARRRRYAHRIGRHRSATGVGALCGEPRRVDAVLRRRRHSVGAARGQRLIQYSWTSIHVVVAGSRKFAESAWVIAELSANA